eukprot:scaffold219005_cov32-Tisochrysis_lutea.AAC.2
MIPSREPRKLGNIDVKDRVDWGCAPIRKSDRSTASAREKERCSHFRCRHANGRGLVPPPNHGGRSQIQRVERCI